MFKFGDVIYRPCISYAGHKNFVLPCVVRNVINREDGDYVQSVDAIRQTWTDNVASEGVTFFKTREAAADALERKICAKKTANA